MATYAEIAAISNDPSWSGLIDKVRVAVAIKAAAVIDSATPPAILLEWAKSAVSNPGPAANAIVYYVVAKNSAAAISAITSASDAAVQTNVNAAVDALYGG